MMGEMTENVPPNSNGANGDVSTAGIPFYEKQRQKLKDLLMKKRALDTRLVNQEKTIFQKETEYLESTPSGNIITGFDNYIKGLTGAAAQRRKTGLSEANRVFSRSSISYNPSADALTPASANSTPVSHTPTPVSASFAGSSNKDGAATPTSATATKASKKSRKAAAAAIEDSETDSRETKKARTSTSASRK